MKNSTYIKKHNNSMLLRISKVLLISLAVMTSACVEENPDSIDVNSKLKSCNITTAEPVIVFSVPWCKYCKQMKAKLKSQNINFHEINVEATPENREMYNCIGGKNYPFLVVDGNVINVNKPNLVDKALKPYIK